jgi:putative peptidoglycan lipid II flippase
VRQVLILMLPVSVGLGLINIDVVLNSTIGSRVSNEVPRAIDAAFRIYMLPQGMFSVAVATVLFPQLARLAAQKDYEGLRRVTGNGIRQIGLLLIPSAAAMCALATPIVRLVFQHGHFNAHSTELTSQALLWFAFSLPFSGFILLLTRSFFSLQRPWVPTTLALGSLVVNAIVSFALVGPLGIGGIILGTIVSNAVLVIAEAFVLRDALGGFETLETLSSFSAMFLGATILGWLSYYVWKGLDDLLGQSLIAQILSVGIALAVGGITYMALMLGLKVPEARQILDLFARRVRRRS